MKGGVRLCTTYQYFRKELTLMKGGVRLYSHNLVLPQPKSPSRLITQLLFLLHNLICYVQLFLYLARYVL
jgi:hypothetical protein